ncbi:MAG: cellulase family glycosylhydrolase [Myxococcota bacterium]
MNRRSRYSTLGWALVLASCGGSETEPADAAGSSGSSLASSDGSADAASSGDGSDGPTDPTDPGSTSSADSSSDDGPPGDCEAEGFHVDGGTLYDDHCNPFVFRGLNYPYAWFAWRDDTEQQFADIAAAGANTMRIVLANGEQWERIDGRQLTQVIDWAKSQRLVVVLEIHDATGWSEQASAADPQTAVDYWLSPDIRSAIDGNEAFVIINIANEPLGNDTTDQWVPFHSGAIAELRRAGLRHTLIVDAPNWGQDWSGTMRDGVAAQQIFDADPDGNVVFSVHMYDVYGTEPSVQSYFDEFLASGLPLIVGEFAADHGPKNPVAAEAIMAASEAASVGYLGWSWSGNSAELASLDIVVDFSGANLSPWGEMLVNGPNGLQATAQTCSCYE